MNCFNCIELLYVWISVEVINPRIWCAYSCNSNNNKSIIEDKVELQSSTVEYL